MLKYEIAVLRYIMDAALQAQKDAAAAQNAANTVAISKSDAAIMKELDGIKSLLAATAEAVDDRIADLTQRFNLVMPRGEFIAEHERNDSRLKVLETSSANLAGKLWAIGALLTLANFALSYWGHVHP